MCYRCFVIVKVIFCYLLLKFVESGDTKLYRLNDEKVVIWLQKKTDNLIESLKQNQTFVNNITKSKTGKFRLSLKEPSQNDDEKIAAQIEEKVRLNAVQLMADYLSPKWTKLLVELYQ
jgi:hypothetical protein